MNRLIHAAVRRDLDRLSAALQTFPDGDPARARDLDRAFVNLRRELTHHHEGEDTHIWPMLAEGRRRRRSCCATWSPSTTRWPRRWRRPAPR